MEKEKIYFTYDTITYNTFRTVWINNNSLKDSLLKRVLLGVNVRPALEKFLSSVVSAAGIARIYLATSFNFGKTVVSFHK